MKVSYGNFDFFAGGDLQYNGRSSHAWKDAELPCAKAVGQVELLKANHHGVTNTNQVDALKALNPQSPCIFQYTHFPLSSKGADWNMHFHYNIYPEGVAENKENHF